MTKHVHGTQDPTLDVFGQFGASPTPDPEQRPRRVFWGLLAFAGLVAVAALVLAAIVLIRNSGDGGQTGAEAAYAAAVQELGDEAAVLRTEAEAAQQLLNSSADQVADDTVRVALATEVSNAQDLLARAQSVEPESGFSAATTIDNAAEDVRELTAAATAQRETLASAVASVASSQTQFQTDQARAAREEAAGALTTSIQNGEAVYAGSAGRVADDAVRQSLRVVLDSTPATVAAAAGDGDLAALVAGTQSLTDAKVAVDAATQAVAAAEATWQAEQDLQAQEAERQQQELADAQRQAQLDWLRQQQPAGNDPATGGPWWRFQDPQGAIWCLYSNGSISPC